MNYSLRTTFDPVYLSGKEGELCMMYLINILILMYHSFYSYTYIQVYYTSKYHNWIYHMRRPNINHVSLKLSILTSMVKDSNSVKKKISRLMTSMT